MTPAPVEGMSDGGTAPTISIITVVYNGRDDIEGAIRSVLRQTYEPVEYVVLDGGSTDGTVEVIRRYEAELAHWASGSDRNMYDALNKGIAATSGDVIGIVNADDRLLPDAVNRVASAFAADPDADFAYASIDLVNENDEVVGRTAPLPADEMLRSLHREMPLPHPGCFIRRRVYAELGGYDIRYGVSGDYDLVARMLRRGYRGVRIDGSVSRYRVGGASSGLKGYLENLQVQKELGVSWLPRHLTFIEGLVKNRAVQILPRSLLQFLVGLRGSSRHRFQ